MNGWLSFAPEISFQRKWGGKNVAFIEGSKKDDRNDLERKKDTGWIRVKSKRKVIYEIKNREGI